MKDFFVKLTSFTDERGRLTPVSTRGTDLPFEVGRVFWITDVPETTERGCHAHRTCWEALFALHGSLKVEMDDGLHAPFTVVLDKPEEGLLIPHPEPSVSASLRATTTRRVISKPTMPSAPPCKLKNAEANE